MTSRDIFVSHENQVRVDYSRLKNHTFGALGCTFVDCDFSGMRPKELVFASGREPTHYIRCKFDGLRVKKLVAGQARFEQCSFLDVHIQGLFTHAAEFVDCVFSGELRASVFFGRVCAGREEDTDRRLNEFHGNDFSAMRFIDVDFRMGIDLQLQRLPTGPDYFHLRDAQAKLSRLREKYLHHPPSQLRQEIFIFLTHTEEQVRNGQTELFLYREDPLLSPHSVEIIWEEFRKMDTSFG